MIKRTVTYEDFNGVTHTEDLYFNLTKTEMSKIVLEEAKFDPDGNQDEESMNAFSDRLREIGRSGDGKKIIDMFEWLLKISYGEKSEDGRRFVKNDEVYEDWRYSASYDQFWQDLMLSETGDMVEFINGIIPADLMKAAENDPEFQSHRKALEGRQSE